MPVDNSKVQIGGLIEEAPLPDEVNLLAWRDDPELIHVEDRQEPMSAFQEQQIAIEEAEARMDEMFAVDEELPILSNRATLERLEEAEGTSIHLDNVINTDTPNGILTLPYGIVPDSGVTHDDATVNPRKHSLTEEQLAEVDYSNAVAVGIKRADYDSDESWADAVVDVYRGRVTATAHITEDEFSDLDDEVQDALIAQTWNTGTPFGSLIRTAKAETEADALPELESYLGNLRSGGSWNTGMANRRASDYNGIAEAKGWATITSVDIDTQTKKFTFRLTDGSTIVKDFSDSETPVSTGNGTAFRTFII